MKKTLLIIGLGAFIVSCTPNIVNTWNIDKFEVADGKGQNSTSENIGTITFEKDGTGKKNIKYNVFQNEYSDEATFYWDMDETHISIEQKNTTEEEEESSETQSLNKTWIIITDKKKEKVWKSTDGGSSVQTIKLSRD